MGEHALPAYLIRVVGERKAYAMPSLVTKLAAAATIGLAALAAPSAASAGKVLYLSTAEMGYGLSSSKVKDGIDSALAKQCEANWEAYVKEQKGADYTGFISDRGGLIPMMFGATDGTQTKGALLSLKEAAEGNGSTFRAYPGVLSTEDQIKDANCFNGTQKCGLSTEKFDARDDVDVADGWTEALAELRGLGGGDVVVLMSGYEIIAPEKAAILEQEIQAQAEKPENERVTFVMLLDTCADCSYDSHACAQNDFSATEISCDGNKACKNRATDQLSNLKSVALTTAIDNNDWGLVVNQLGNSLNYKTPLNKESPYVNAEELGMTELRGHTGGALMCLPQQNVIFPAPVPQGGGYQFELGEGVQGQYC